MLPGIVHLCNFTMIPFPLFWGVSGAFLHFILCYDLSHFNNVHITSGEFTAVTRRSDNVTYASLRCRDVASTPKLCIIVDTIAQLWYCINIDTPLSQCLCACLVERVYHSFICSIHLFQYKLFILCWGNYFISRCLKFAVLTQYLDNPDGTNE